jgi:hypothetical protein
VCLTVSHTSLRICSFIPFLVFYFISFFSVFIFHYQHIFNIAKSFFFLLASTIDALWWIFL